MREKIVKMREKMRQPKMSKFLLHFWTFQRGYKNQSPKVFSKNVKNSHFYVVKFDNVQNEPYFCLFAQCAKALSKCARGGARCAIFAQLRKIWQHWSLSTPSVEKSRMRLSSGFPLLLLLLLVLPTLEWSGGEAVDGGWMTAEASGLLLCFLFLSFKKALSPLPVCFRM